MKQCSPILLFLFFFFFQSCKHENPILQRSEIAKKINLHIDKSKDPSETDSSRIENARKSVALSSQFKIDSLLYKSLHNRAELSIYIQNDSAEFNLNRLKDFVKKKPISSHSAGYYQLMGNFLRYSKMDSSYYYHNKAKNLFITSNDSLSVGYNLLVLSELQMASSDYVEVQSLATDALHYLKNQKNINQYICHLNTTIGLSHLQLEDYDEALSYFNEALKYADNELSKNTIKNDIGLVYKNQKQYDKAISIFAALSTQKNLDAFPAIKARIIDNLGDTKFLNGDNSGIYQMKTSESIKDSIGDTYGLVASYIHQSHFYLDQNKATSRIYAKKAFETANSLNNNEDALEALKLMTITSDSQAEMLQLFLQYVSLNDSIKSAAQQAKNQFAKLKYDSREKEKELLEQKAANIQIKLIAEKAKNRNILTVTFMVVLAMMGFLFFKATKFKHAKEKVKEIYNTEIRISKKVHDELANDVYKAMNYANGQNFETSEKKEILVSALDSIYNRTRDISRENSPIELGENYPLQLKEMLSEYQTETLNVIILNSEEINWNAIDENKKTIVFRVLQELMINMKKHSQATLTSVKFDVVNKNITINYSDNGIGFSPEKTFLKNGLQNVENRIYGINGTITFDKNNSKGISISIAFPA